MPTQSKAKVSIAQGVICTPWLHDCLLKDQAKAPAKNEEENYSKNSIDAEILTDKAKSLH